MIIKIFRKPNKKMNKLIFVVLIGLVAGAWAQTQTCYNYAGITSPSSSHAAYVSEDTSGATIALTSMTLNEFTNARYVELAAPFDEFDGVFELINGFTSSTYAHVVFEFDADRIPSSVTTLNATFSLSMVDTAIVGTYEVYIWNFQSSSWELRFFKSENTGLTLTVDLFDVTSVSENYFSLENKVYYQMVNSQPRTDGFGISLGYDYAQLCMDGLLSTTGTTGNPTTGTTGTTGDPTTGTTGTTGDPTTGIPTTGDPTTGIPTTGVPTTGTTGTTGNPLVACCLPFPSICTTALSEVMCLGANGTTYGNTCVNVTCPIVTTGTTGTMGHVTLTHVFP